LGLAATPAPLAAALPGEWSAGNQVQLLQGGAQLFPAMAAAFATAQREVWLATYIFATDEAGQQLCQALAAAARRGVTVRVVVDGFGCLHSLPTLRQWLEPAGVQLLVFRPLAPGWWRQGVQPAQLRRMHFKLCVVDGQQAFVGGINVLDDHHEPGHSRTERPRLDFAVALHGPVVGAVSQTLGALWLRTRLWQGWPQRMRERVSGWRRGLGLGLARVRRLAQESASRAGRSGALGASGAVAAPGFADASGMQAMLLVRDNLYRRRSIERSYLQAIGQATQRVDVVTPYFYPSRLFLRALVHAARRGVRVRLLLQGRPDYWLASLAARGLYAQLLAQGLEIYEYTSAFLHAKVALVDDVWATVGSSNVDPLSLLLNLEANVVVRDAGFQQTLAVALEAALAQSERITQAPLATGWRAKLARALVAWVARLYLRLADARRAY